ncbi:hypothetical protein [Streptomyces sp. OE57]|uniref:hypothetical protein n=1 Tax=Streptomyces lacaronensis TaxID=3379885 RepID=UPI0039B764B8
MQQEEIPPIWPVISGSAAELTQHVIHRLPLTQGVHTPEQWRANPVLDRHPDPQHAPATVGDAVFVCVTDPHTATTVSRRDHSRERILACPRSDVRHAHGAREVLARSWTPKDSTGVDRQHPAGGGKVLIPTHVQSLRNVLCE